MIVVLKVKSKQETQFGGVSTLLRKPNSTKQKNSFIPHPQLPYCIVQLVPSIVTMLQIKTKLEIARTA